MLRIAHISDLHFSEITLNPSQFFSKRCVGNANLILCRRKKHSTTLLSSLPDLFKSLAVDLVIVAGDFSTTGRKIEFEKAKQFIESFKEKGMKLLAVPGNHDHYIGSNYKKKVFYQHFTNPFPGEGKWQNLSLKDDKIELRPINEDWWYLAIDTVIPTSWISSRGLFSKELEEKLGRVLADLPPNKKILFVNHFPFFQFDNPRHILLRGMALHDLLKKRGQVLFYLHGHTHRHCIADLRCANLPIILDSGSATLRKSASFNLLELSPQTSKVTVYNYLKDNWQKTKDTLFNL